MRLGSFLFTIFFSNLLVAQNPLDIKRIDSVVEVISVKAANKKYKVIEGTLLLEANKTSNIRFHLDGSITEMIVVESNMKDHATLYYFKDSKLIYVANFANGDYNEVESLYYFTDNSAYRKEKSKFKKINRDLFTVQISSYFDLLKEQLKEK